MLALGIIIVLLAGFMAAYIMSPRLAFVEKAGVSLPLGLGIQTFLMTVLDMCGVRLTATSVLIAGTGTLALLAVASYFRGMAMRNVPRQVDSVKADYNLLWLLMVCLIVYFEYMNITKCLYFPTFDRDSLAGFDTIGYVVAKEHTFSMVSLFDTVRTPGIHNAGSYISYAPLTQLSYAYVYLLGASASKIIPALMYLSLVIAFYGTVRRVAGRTCASVAAFLMMVTPEMISFSSMSATNCIHAVSASLGVIYMALWFKGRDRGDLLLGAALLAVNVWTRSDGVVFIMAALAVAVVVAWHRHAGWRSVAVVACAFLPMIYWALFCKVSGFYADSIVTPYLFWDPEKAATVWRGVWSLLCNTDRFGLTFIVMFVAFIINIWTTIKRRGNATLIFMIVLSLTAYMVMLYQIDYKWDTIGNVLAYSAKRFLFCFVPLAWYYAASSRLSVWAFAKIDKFLS